MLQDLGDGPGAIAAFQTAVDLGSNRAVWYLSLGHLKSKFGEYSDPGFGFSEMQKLALEGSKSAKYELAEAHRVGRGTMVALPRVIALYSELNDADDARGTERLAWINAKGMGTETNIPLAIELYQRAVLLGRSKSNIPLANLLVESGRADEAKAVFELAAETRTDSAVYALAIAHFEGIFGVESDPDLGISELLRLSEAGYTKAARTVVAALGDQDNRPLPGLEPALDTLLAAMRKGDTYATESLIIFYRERPELVADAVARRREILTNYRAIIRSKTYYPEMVYQLFMSKHGSDLRRELLELFRGADEVGYPYGLYRVFRLSKETYTYLLQAELRELGYSNFSINGKMTRNTITATLNFCRENGFFEECNHGPLLASNVKLIAGALATERN